ncbi:MAG TPA: hypothetical protein VF708_12215 [Pyrinomonadaceae bacterium]
MLSIITGVWKLSPRRTLASRLARGRVRGVKVRAVANSYGVAVYQFAAEPTRRAGQFQH